ncbi:MAG TPA: BspA family leucine-rich repeat surface protein [Campylobacterales bacterium]|nr:BspA family leucine-rich repeat surface protein [Campylobacterales bacterium]
MIVKKSFYGLVFVLLFLTGCGSDISSAEYTEVPKKGYVIDAPVVNLTYSCGTKVAKTTEGGLFICPTLPVTFSVGGLTLGTITNINNDSKVFVQDIVKSNRNDFTSTEVLKLALFLQTLNKSNDKNQIIIDDSITFSSENSFSEMNITEVETLLKDKNLTLVSQSEVEQHLREFSDIDTLSPTITLNGEANITIAKGTTYKDPGANVSDDRDTTVTLNTTGSVDNTKVGIYTITYTSTDKVGNTSSVTRTVTVVDVLAPTLSLIGESTIILAQNGIYNELGATALDNVDGDISSNITITGQVDSKVLGSYKLTYNSTDKAGNTSSLIRTVNVVDQTAPTLTILDDKLGTLRATLNESKRWIPNNLLLVFEFSEPVVGFDINDISISSGVKGAFSGSGTSYILEVNGIALNSKIPIVVTVAEGTYSDNFGNLNTTANQMTQPVNTEIPFITVWDTEDNITIPTNPEFTYNYSVDWGDGTYDVNVTGDITHEYAASGQYTVSIGGKFPSLYFNLEDDYNESKLSNNEKILAVEQWGTIEWQSMEQAFYNCFSLEIDQVDIPNLEDVYSMKSMFQGAEYFNDPLDDWDVSSVDDMSYMFAGALDFNQSLNDWDVSAVEDMSYMFQGAESFNQPLNNWQVNYVEDMSHMFEGATDFNQSLNDWNVGFVNDMSYMFASTPVFNQPLNNWDVSFVGNMSSMFSQAINFNQELNDWDVSFVDNMNATFAEAWAFNQPLDNWDTSDVENMSDMFAGAVSFNQPLNSWDVSFVQDMSYMFTRAELFNQPLDNWDTSYVNNMESMFAYAENFSNQDLSAWDVSEVTNHSDFSTEWGENNIEPTWVTE